MVELEDINSKNCRVYYTDDIINIENLDLDMILIYKRQYQINYTKIVISTRPILRSNKCHFDLFLQSVCTYYKTSDSHQCKVCHYWYYFKTTLTYLSLLRNGVNDLPQKSLSLDYILIEMVGKIDYRLHF